MQKKILLINNSTTRNIKRKWNNTCVFASFVSSY